jgi:transcriptional regulator with XRE-family HTH domain
MFYIALCSFGEQEEAYMNQLDKNIATNLKRIRKARNMSLDMLAEKTGVSKSMLGQIERGESNPTVATIAKIVDGMRVSFEELIYPKTESVVIIDNEKLPIYKSEEGAYQVRSIFPYDRHRNFEVYQTKIEPGEGCASFLGDNISEYIMVIQGVLTLDTNDGTYEVAANHAIKLDASACHGYHNRGMQELVLNIFVAYDTVGNR